MTYRLEIWQGGGEYHIYKQVLISKKNIHIFPPKKVTKILKCLTSQVIPPTRYSLGLYYIQYTLVSTNTVIMRKSG